MELPGPREITGCCLTPITKSLNVSWQLEWFSLPRAQKRPPGERCLTSKLSYSSLSQATLLHQSVQQSYKCFLSTFELHGTEEQRRERLILSRGGCSRERSRDGGIPLLLDINWTACMVVQSPVIMVSLLFTFTHSTGQISSWNTMRAHNQKETAWAHGKALDL